MSKRGSDFKWLEGGMKSRLREAKDESERETSERWKKT